MARFPLKLIGFIGVSFSFVVLLALQRLLPVNLINKYHLNLNKSSPSLKYDYIIVGAGTAGSVLANRLSADRSKTVLLLEAGPTDNDIRLKVPAAWYENFNSVNDWNYDSVAQKQSNDNVIYHPRGKTIGGSSSINAMIYLRGSQADYDQWETKYNLKGWNWKTALKYFKKTQKQTNTSLSSEFHSFDGLWSISNGYQHSTSHSIVKAMKQVLNIPYVDDFNGEHLMKEGIGFNQVNIDKGKRCSLADAMLTKQVLQRDNLYIWTNTQVHKVLFQKKTAIGVLLINNNSTILLKDKGEVILSAGAYNSPQLLQLSGIGDASLLSSLKIPVIYNNSRVGQNLMDHPLVPLLQYRNIPEGALDQYRSGYNKYKAILDWLLSRTTSPLSSNIGEVNGFYLSTDYKRLNHTVPDFQLIGGPCLFKDHGRQSLPFPGGFTIASVLVQPLSTGNVTIQSADPKQPPLIDPGMFTDKDNLDFKRILWSFKKMLEVSRSKHLTDISSGNAMIDDMQSFMKSEEEQIKYIKDNLILLYHGSCTCAMGQVTDDQLRVYGVDRLRVVDASVMPTIPRVNTNAPTAMIAEHAADIILQTL